MGLTLLLLLTLLKLKIMTITETTLRKAAEFYLQHQGKRGTKKQIAKLLSQITAQNILRMAEERGFKS